jgi:hypothetical protein
MTRHLVVMVAVVAAFARGAAAQTAAGGSSPGPLVLEPIETRFVVAPEYKVTDLDGRTGQMAGITAGALTDNSMFLGGAIYSLTNRASDFKLTYGGLLIGWTVPAGSAVRVGGRALAGFGSATLGDTVQVFDRRTLAVRTINIVGRDDFAVFEPQAQASVRLSGRVNLDGTVGYRLTGMDDVLRDRLDGVTGAIAIQLKW